MSYGTLSRLIENLLRIGTVEQIDLEAKRCRVRSGNLLTNWLPWFSRRAGDTRTWNPPTVGEQVMVLSPSGEIGAGIVLIGIESDAHPSPSSSPAEHVTKYPDGAVVSYNHVTSALSVTGIKSAHIAASGNVSVECNNASVKCAGKASVSSADGIDLDGAGAGQVGGAVQAECLCMFTGAPHAHISSTVKASA